MRVQFRHEYLKDSDGHVRLRVYCSRDVKKLLQTSAASHGFSSVDDYLRAQFMRGEGVIDARYEDDWRAIVIVFRRRIPRWMINTESFMTLAIRSCGMQVAR